MKDLKWDWPTSQSSAMPVQIKNSAPGFVNSAATHLPKLANAHQVESVFDPSRPLQLICKDMFFVIRFRRDASDGDNHGDQGEFGKEIYCALERR